MKYLVTGGAGFIGSNFVRSAFKFKDEFQLESMIVLDNLTYSGNLANLKEIETESSFEFVKGDICDSGLISSLLSRVDVVVNFAAESHVDRSIIDSSAFIQTNIVGVTTILDSLRKYPELRFIQVSTDEVYGSVQIGSATENSPLMPNSPYAASKASADLIIRSYVETYDLDIVITRCTNNYGPFQYPEKLIPFFISKIEKGCKVPVYGTGSNVRDWIHVSDHVEGIRLAIMKGTRGGIYNLGSGNELTNLEITNLLLTQLGKSHEIIEFVEDRLGHDFRYSLDFTKASMELGFRPLKLFSEGISETISWYRSNQDWWLPLVKGV